MPKTHILRLTPQDEVEVASRIRIARTARGLSQKEVAEALDLSQTAISRLESAERRFGLLEAAVLCRFLEISLDALLPLRLQRTEQ